MSSTCRTAQAGRSRRPQAGRDSRRGRQARHAARRVRARKRPTGSRDPFGLRRAAIGLCRLATEGGVQIDRALLPDDVRDFVEERLEGLLDVPVEFVRAARASAVGDLGGVARLAKALHAAERSDEFAAVYEAYERAQRLAGKRDDAAAQVDAALFEHDTERELAESVASLELDPAISRPRCTGPRPSPRSSRASSTT